MSRRTFDRWLYRTAIVIISVARVIRANQVAPRAVGLQGDWAV